MGATSNPARTRRFFSTAALLLGGMFDQIGDPKLVPPINVRDIEHFELQIGIPATTYWERSPGVWQRMFTRGHVIVNAGTAPFVYRYSVSTSYTIQPSDAIVIQNRNSKGHFIRPLTNYGR